MDVTSMLSNDAPGAPEVSDIRRMNHQYPTRHAASTQDQNGYSKPSLGHMHRHSRDDNDATGTSAYGRISPAKPNQKCVLFQLVDCEDPRIQARLPMRVMISTQDTIEGIIQTVKNFYGLYEYGVSLENRDGISMVPAYDNFEHNGTVYIRTVGRANPAPLQGVLLGARDSASPKKPTLGAPFEMRPPPLYTQSHSPTRNGARSAGVRSLSPQSDIERRSASVAPGGKPRPMRTKSRDNSMYGDGEGYSSGDNGGGSVASSRRSKAEVVNPEISTDNIVPGGRRKGAFESSELPLFVPPQVPMSTSISSISPQRRAGPPNAITPYPYSNQQTFSYIQPLPSPQSYGSSAHHMYSNPVANGFSGGFNGQSRQLRGRPNPVTYPPPQGRRPTGGIMPTPDPTVGSAISDEDVALQLMRLGDPMAFSHGRTSTSTVDDAMSGKAELASSDEESDAEDEEDAGLPAARRISRDSGGPQRKKQRVMKELASDDFSGEEYEDRRDGTFTGSDGLNGAHGAHRHTPKHKSHKHRSSMPGSLKTDRPIAKPKSKSLNHSKTPMSPSSMPAPSRKGSIASAINFQHQMAVDEDDLSSKPRCQRCRKSKKGCDRERPCGRCKDAGIGIEGCVSEDEGNGRKGRYGRHMGVTVRKSDESLTATDTVAMSASVPTNGYFLAPALPDKSKKRKR